MEIYRVLTLSKKKFQQRCFFCEFCEISHEIFFKEPFGRLLHKHSFCLLSQHNLVPFQKRCHAYFPAEYFFGLICRLRTRVTSVLQNLSQKPIFNPVEYLTSRVSKQPLKGVVKWKTKTWEIFITLSNFEDVFKTP